MTQDNEYYPLAIFLQRLDDFGEEVGESVQTTNEALLHCQIYDHIKNPRVVDNENPDAHLKGEWTVQEREFQENRYDGYARNRYLTIYIIKRK